jgi:hypothetical protein
MDWVKWVKMKIFFEGKFFITWIKDNEDYLNFFASLLAMTNFAISLPRYFATYACPNHAAYKSCALRIS